MRQAEARDIRNRIDLARNHAEEAYRKRLARALALYKGDHYGPTPGKANQDQIVVNLLYAIVETKVKAIAFNYPDFTLKAMSEEAEGNKDTVRALLDYTFRVGKFLDVAQRIWRDFQIGGLGVGLTGWKLEVGRRGKIPATYQGERPNVLGEPPDPTQNAGNPDTLTVMPPKRKDRPFLARIRPSDFFVSPEAESDLEESSYAGYTERVPLAKVKANKRYENTRSLTGDVDNLKGLYSEEMLRYTKEDTPDDLKRVTLHHYYDRERLTYTVMADGSKDPLYHSEWPYAAERYPFRVMRAGDDEDCFWPMPTLLRYEHPQREVNQARSILARHQRQSVPRYQTSARLSETAKRQLRSDGQLGIVELEGQERIETVPRLPVQMEIFQSVEAASQDLQFLAAMNAYEAFAEPSKRVTQSEVAAIQGQGSARAKAEQQTFEKFLSDVAQDTLEYLQEYSVAGGMLPVFARGEVKEWRPFTLEEIQGEYWVEVFVGSTMAPNRTALAKELMLFMQSMPNLVTGIQSGQMVGLDLKELFKQILEGFPEIRDVNRIVPEGQGMGAGQLPPEILQSLMGQPGMVPGAGGQQAPPFPGFGPDGSFDPAAADGWLRGLSDEDLGAFSQEGA